MNLRINATELHADPDHQVMTALLSVAVDVGVNEWRQYGIPFIIEAHSTPADCWRAFRECVEGADTWMQELDG